MASFAQALMGFGGRVSDYGSRLRSQKREEELDPLRKRLLELELQAKQSGVEKAEEEAEHRAGARKSVSETLGMLSRDYPLQLPKAEAPEFKQPRLEEESGKTQLDMPNLMRKYQLPEDPPERVTKPSLQEALFATGAAGYMDRPEVKNLVSAFGPQSEGVIKSRGKYNIQAEKSTDEDRRQANELINAMEKEELLSPTEAMALRYSVPNNAIGVKEDIGKRLSIAPAESRKKFMDLYSPKVSLAEDVAEARVTGGAQGIKRVPDKTRESITADYNNIKNLSRVANNFNPKYVGPVKGRAGNVSEWIGLMGADEKEFRAQVQNYVNQLIKSTTGAAMSEPEAKRIMRETVDFKMNPESYFRTLESNIETIKMRLGSAVKGLEATKHDVADLNNMISDLDEIDDTQNNEIIELEDMFKDF